MIPLNDLGFDPEFALVGGLMVFADRVPIPPEVTAEWFANPAARTIWGAIVDVAMSGRMHEAIAVRDRLATTGQLERIGGDDMLAAVLEACPSPAILPGLVDTLRPQYVRRKVREVADWLRKTSERDDLTLSEIASRLAEGAAIAMGANRAPVCGIGSVEHDGDDLGVSSGFEALDALVSTAGYPCGQVSIVSATHKGGKTTLMLSSALKQMQAGRRVLWATFADLNAKQVKRRLMRNLCGRSRRPYALDLAAEYDESLAWLNAAPLDVYDATALSSGFDVDTFAGWLRSNADRARYDCVFVDYAQKLRATKAANRFAEGDYCSEVMARLAAQVGIPIVVGSQITPGGKDGETKTKNSRAWEEDAGLVVRLKREGTLVECEVPYSRFGPSGEFYLRWDSDRLSMDAM
jgi:replicative DNA helicase